MILENETTTYNFFRKEWEEERENAIEKMSKMDIKFETKVNSIQLLTIGEDHSLKSKEDFYLWVHFYDCK